MRQNETAKTKYKTSRQLLALPYIAAAPSLAEGARTANVARATLHRWMQDNEFRSQLQRMRDEAANLAHVELQGLMLKSVLVLADALDDPDQAARFRAARAALHVALRAEEARGLRKRLDDALSMLKAQL